jgi:hypothetical protein
MASNSNYSLTPPSQDDLTAALAQFNADWGLIDEVLYGLCREHPGHDDRRAVTAKLAMVGRVYAAGLERRVTPPPGQQAIVVIADYILEHGNEVDDIIQALGSVDEPLDSAAMATIVEQHGRLTELLREVATDHKAPRSFASKYLHFHRPMVPIYDEYARQAITRQVRWESSYAPFSPPSHADRDYWDYCVRFFRLYDSCRQTGTAATVKELDAFLWAVPTNRESAKS